MDKDERILKQKLELLFKEHFTQCVYFAQKYLGDLDSSKEVVHAVFVKIWENRHEFEFDKPAKSYLFTSVYNRSLNLLRDKKKFYNPDNDEVLVAAMESGEYSDTLEVAELEVKIKSAIANLPTRCREVFELSRFEGKKYAEIAVLLGISEKTVEAQMTKALKILKQDLREYLYLLLLILLKNTSL